MQRVTHDFGEWPLLRIRVGAPPSIEVAEAIRAAMDLALAEARPHVFVLRLEARGLPNPRLVRDQARWFDARRGLLTAHCRGIGVVTASAAMRGIPNALSRIVHLPTSFRAFEHEEAAEAWCRRKLGLDRP